MIPRLKVLKYYPYRKGRIGAYAGSHVLMLPIEMMRDCQRTLAGLAKVSPDNHTCFLVEIDSAWGERQVKAFMFSDDTMYIGDRIEEKSW